jgi:hypothetical protein
MNAPDSDLYCLPAVIVEICVRDIVPSRTRMVESSSMCLRLNRIMNMTRYVSLINCFSDSVISFLSLFSHHQQIKDELCEVVQEMESHDSENKHSSKEKQMSIGRKKFNMDPKKGELT